MNEAVGAVVSMTNVVDADAELVLPNESVSLAVIEYVPGTKPLAVVMLYVPPVVAITEPRGVLPL